jgi:nucleotide-binding universal stress UspA family protein
MFKKIAVVFDESPSASHALTSAIALAKTLGSELQTVTMVEPPAAYTGYVSAAPLLSQVLSEGRVKFYERLQETVQAEGRRHSIAIHANLVTGDEVAAIVAFLRQEKMDLRVLELHSYTPRMARLWSTVSGLEQEAPCSVLGIH